ncbi:MAG: OsmC family protein [candidate division KSB1 bacterium]|nr:OsmC family protein [candidate division KSB1 bacterium]
MKRTAKAVWKGKGPQGSGVLSTQSKVLQDQAYSFKSRFEDKEGKQGTNPEELIAAAHAGCFAMALSAMLAEQDFTTESLHVEATLTLDKKGEGFEITGSHLSLEAQIPDIDNDTFQTVANQAKDGCPVSAVLNCEKTLTAILK